MCGFKIQGDKSHDITVRKADFQEDGDWKLQIFAYLHVGVTILSITIGIYS